MSGKSPINLQSYFKYPFFLVHLTLEQKKATNSAYADFFV